LSPSPGTARFSGSLGFNQPRQNRNQQRGDRKKKNTKNWSANVRFADVSQVATDGTPTTIPIHNNAFIITPPLAMRAVRFITL